MKRVRTGHLLLWVGAWILFATWILLFLGRDSLKYYTLVRSGDTTEARVIGKEPDRHRGVRYEFSVKGQTYTGVGRAGFGNPDFDFLKVGDQVLAYYLPDQPSVSCLGRPGALLRNDSIPLLLAAFLFPTIVLLVRPWKHFRK